MTPGIHLFHKPVGPTSFSLVQECIRTIHAAHPQHPPSVCHGGTLDPFASGLLLILVEPATQLFDYLHAVPKVYEATVRWGVETENGDPLGNITSTGDTSVLTPARLDEVLGTFVGWREQTPHVTSARRVGGERAYVRARRGEQVQMPAAQVYLHEASWLAHDLPNQSRLRITVRGGYYVRALARDIGRTLRCGAHLGELHRVSIGPWSDPGPGKSGELHGSQILPWAIRRILTDQEVGELRQGRYIPRGKLLPSDWDLPAGFPNPQAPIRGFHKDLLRFLLDTEGDKLRARVTLRGGL